MWDVALPAEEIAEHAGITTKYRLIVDNGGHGTATGDGLYDAGSAASFGISPTVVPDTAGVQYVFTGADFMNFKYNMI